MARAAILSSEEVRAYWRAHSARYAAIDSRADPEGLTNVCKPGAPLWLNRFFAHFQRVSMARALAATGPVRNLRALDLGCGTGRWARWLSKLGARVVGVDIQREAVRAAQGVARHKDSACGPDGSAARYGEMSADTLGFRDGAFDLVVSVTVLQHVPPAVRAQTVAELFRVLSPGGRVVAHEGGRPPSGRAPALFPLREEGWLALFRQAGLEAAYVAGTQYSPLLPWAQRGEALVRRCLDRGRRKAAHSPVDLVAETARANRRMGWITRLAVIASYPLEHFCAAVLPRRAATFCTMVFRKPAGGAP